MNINYEVKHPTLDYSKLSESFKSVYGYELPEEYIQFLNQNGTGLFPDPGLFDVYEVGVILKADPNEESHKDEHSIYYVNNMLQQNMRLSSNIFAFAKSPDSHSTFCVILSGPLKDKIIILNDESIQLSENYSISDLDPELIAADSFTDFINSLEEL